MRLLCLCLCILAYSIDCKTIRLSDALSKRNRKLDRRLMLGALTGGGGGGGLMPNNDLLKEKVLETEKEIDDTKEWMRQKRGKLISNQ